MSTAARRLSAEIENLLARRAELEAEAAILATAPKAGNTQAAADRRALAEAHAKDLKDGGTREAELRAQFATRDNASANELAMQQKAARQTADMAARIKSELNDTEVRLIAVERELDAELRRIAKDRTADMLPRYQAIIEEMTATAMELACLQAMAATRDADKVPWLVIEVPLFDLKAKFIPPEGFKITHCMLTTDARPMLEIAAKRYDALRAEITGNA